ncbi:MAG: hypothetical protein AAF591_22455 [Verrucomicrobiota bacterium]
MTTPPPVPNADVENLNLLAIFHYILGALHIFIACFFLIYVAMGIMVAVSAPEFEPHFSISDSTSHEAPAPSPPGAPDLPKPPVPPAPELPVMPAPVAAMGWFMTAFGAVAFLLGTAFGILTIISGRKLKKHTARTFSFVIAAINCLFVPLGTALGVFTIVVLNRQSVQQLYKNQN